MKVVSDIRIAIRKDQELKQKQDEERLEAYYNDSLTYVQGRSCEAKPVYEPLSRRRRT